MSNRRIKVLHATMSLGIGGAETHIIELAKRLNNDQFQVIVASNGGVYEEELKACGIKHCKVPLYTKNPFKVLASYRKLKRLICDERIDIVHAHARIPAFILGLICRKQNVSIVTTTHFNFRVNWLFRKISNWGTKSIAVSRDLKQYLIEEYKYAEDDVYLSVNGIDVNKFRPQRKKDGSTKNIVHVSRLDGHTSQVTKMLIESADQLHSLDTDIRILVAGNGTEYDHLKKLADKCNKAMGIEMIRLLGSVSDVPSLLDKGDLFVGISRAALEAMNYGMPVVLAGDYGMLGLLTPSMLENCESHNFTCRGEAPLDKDQLMENIVNAYHEIGEDYTWLRAYIEENYSVDKMAEPYIKLYNDLMSEAKSYVIAGYYGYSNSGDDALLNSVCRDIHNNNIKNQVTILTNESIDKTSHYMKAIKSVYRFNLLKVLSTIKKSDILVMGGGTLMQDITSSRSIWYYLAVIWVANIFHKRVMLYANGIGPVNKGLNRWLVRHVLDNIDVITLREEYSRKTLEELEVIRPYIEVTADPVFSLPFDEKKDLTHRFREAGIDPSKPYCVAIFRGWKQQDKAFNKKISELCDYIVDNYGLQMLFLPMKYPSDIKCEEKIRSLMSSPSCIMLDKCDVQTVVDIIGGAQLTLSMRLHGILYSALKVVPAVGFSYDVKIDYYSEVLGMPYQDVRSIDILVLKQAIDEILSDTNNVKEHLKEKLMIQRKRASNNAQLLRELL